jgi:acylphosphatase
MVREGSKDGANPKQGDGRGWRVEGRVQGVGFRWFVREKATGLGLSGWVRNEADGSVRVEARGNAEALAQLEAVLAVGPPAAEVKAVRGMSSQGEEGWEGFEIRFGGEMR